ncbi:hypothetical protein [Streptomyces fulvorobeus]|uniref:Uncharacterized protein n=1 Tax=Streptomyces fulvorobeus TaxID=284028 RepID=A0A7J0CGD1_9ACTN|nr:hypothetical protein [Streptomyces fulvorobeus]NYE44261.1 hypothetical protein [Streptomyces fulvorobeus]GFN00777.1 hypothetical protein Sfulv_55870 [Streptomyces fulvorobeus]
MSDVTIHETVTIPARQIRRGDEFDLHRHTHTASGHAHMAPRDSVRIPLEGGGEAFLPKDREIRVSRPAGTLPTCISA